MSAAPLGLKTAQENRIVSKINVHKHRAKRFIAFDALDHVFNHQTHHRGQVSQILDELGARFPGSRFVDWQWVHYYEELKEYRTAAAICSRLRESYRHAPDGAYNALATGFRAAQNLQRAGDAKAVYDLCRTLGAECAAITSDDDGMCRDITKLMQKAADSD